MGITPRPFIDNEKTDNTAIKYKVITVDQKYCSLDIATTELEKKVNQYLKDGWSLQGGASVGLIHSNSTFCICQAMVKYPERKIEKENDLPGRAVIRI